MTKDLAILIGPEQSWMTTEQFFEAIRRQSRGGDGGGSSARLSAAKLLTIAADAA